ncbi:MAG: LysE family translocator [Paraglaciecola sp.]|uniref:LysE family translocator n=1 Tax=Pseudomonadati TaxID=3379134 RepID=UPI00273EA74C|nr:LysE family translocator [Paraglaciecola sp.]MDP5029432.1 LysE family translocator [Paraglaciecola sp.]MDP5133019.1 LysE family translocator [Paraglaciecola sp.]
MFDAFSQYWLEFLTIASVHILAVASPGPDFAIVLKHSISYGRRVAIYTSIGIGLAIMLHVAYSLLGIGLLIQNTPGVFSLLSYAAAAYLLYIGWGAIRSKAPQNTNELNTQQSTQTMSDKKAFWVGFLTNGLNPKATLFFLSVFAVAVSAQTPNHIKLVYGLYLSVATGVWFCGLSYLLSSSKVRGFLSAKGYWFDRIMGAVLILLAAKLAFTA